VNGREIEFDWDEANIAHLARHTVTPEEAEQVMLSDPVDLGMVRVVTAFVPIKRLVQFYYQERGN